MEKDARLVVDFYEFNEDDYNYLVKKCMLNEELSLIFKYKIQGYSNIGIMIELRNHKIYLSEATLSRRINLLKRKIIKNI